MALEETNIANEIRIEMAKKGASLFKNVRGLFYTRDKKRLVLAGLLADGASDLIGFRRVIVTPEMVGKTVAVFVAIEVKTLNPKRYASQQQKDFIAAVIESGGLAGVARSPEAALNILDGDPDIR